MKPVSFISDDGQFQGTEAQVLAYEERQKDPLGWLRLPVGVAFIGTCFHLQTAGVGRVTSLDQLEALAQVANLAPDLFAMFQRSNQLLEDGDDSGWTQQMMAFISELEPKFMAAIREPK